MSKKPESLIIERQKQRTEKRDKSIKQAEESISRRVKDLFAIRES